MYKIFQIRFICGPEFYKETANWIFYLSLLHWHKCVAMYFIFFLKPPLLFGTDNFQGHHNGGFHMFEAFAVIQNPHMAWLGMFGGLAGHRFFISLGFL